MSKNRINVGVIGTGMIGRLHAEHLACRVPGARLGALADVNRAAAQACAQRLEVSAVYEDYHDLLRDPSIDAVVVCSPRQTHARVIAEAAAAGKHIFCEKPIGCGLDEIDQALAAVEKAGVKLQTGFNRRFDADFRQVYETVRAGRIGTPQILHIVSRDPELPGGGAIAPADLFLETTIHDLDMARYLMGSEISSVYAVGGALAAAGAGEIDTAVVTLRFTGGAIGAIDNSLRSAYGYDQRVEVFGSGGAVATANEKPHQATLSDRQGVHQALPLHFFAERYIGSYIAEMTAFAGCVLEDKEPPVTGADGRIAVALALAVERSYREGRPVALDEFAGGSASKSSPGPPPNPR